MSRTRKEKDKPKFTAVFDYSTPPTLNHVAAIYGMSGRQLVRTIRENKDGKYDRLYTNKTGKDK